jgi:hypothetical protein
MILTLTRNRFRDIKTTLLQIPGNPGSAKLGEALARGFEYPDHHALKGYFDHEEQNLTYDPKSFGINADLLMSALDGTDPQAIKDIAATALFLWDESLFMGDLEAFPELSGGRVILTSYVPQAWAKKASSYIKDIFEMFDDDMAFTFTPDDIMWNGIDIMDSNPGACLRIVRSDTEKGMYLSRTRPLDELDFEVIDLYETDEMPNFQFFSESTFLRIRDSVPRDGRDLLKCLMIDSQGVRGIFGGPLDTDPNMEIVYLEVEA